MSTSFRPLRPDPSEYPPYAQQYVMQVTDGDLLAALDGQRDQLRTAAVPVSPDREHFAYAAGKWTMRQVVGHLGDAERVFSYRALCFARGDRTPLPGFDENAYVDHARFNDARLSDLVEELVLLRSANLKMLGALDEGQWSATGTANGRAMSVRALAYVMTGHVRHHLMVLRDRYAVAVGV